MQPLHDTEEKIYMSKIRAAFEKGKALIAFITCGDPDLATTEKAVTNNNGYD